jgi:hypothetical protein
VIRDFSVGSEGDINNRVVFDAAKLRDIGDHLLRCVLIGIQSKDLKIDEETCFILVVGEVTGKGYERVGAGFVSRSHTV